MKRIITIFAAGFAMLLTGCATDMSRYYDVQAKAIEADNNAVMALAAAAAAGNNGAIVALAMRQGQAGKIAPPQDKALQWASILVPAATGLVQGRWGYGIQKAQIGAESERYGLTLGTLGGIASQGIDAAGKVIFPPVYFASPAPAAPASVAVPVE